MKTERNLLLLSVSIAFLWSIVPSGPAAAAETGAHDYQCVPTLPDMLGPFYKPDAPVRSSVGRGYVLKGVVKSAWNCRPIPGARIEFWLAGPEGHYADEYRATVIADDQGAYRFESGSPPLYWGRPPHIHIRVTAGGFQPLITQHYPEEGATEADFPLVLIPGTD